jgi:hypothetical protein
VRQVEVIPEDEFRLYGAIVAKEVELRRKNKGTFRRSGRKEKDRAKWTHSSYKLARRKGEVVEIKIRPKKGHPEWQLLHAILGFVDRHFGQKIRAINIQYD